MTLYSGMNPNYTLLDCIEKYIEEASDYMAYNIMSRINQMKPEDYTAALDLLAEATGKNATWLCYCLTHEAMNYKAHLPFAPRWA